MPDTPSASSASASSSNGATSEPRGKKPTGPYIGGQAVLEGVMMRSPTSFAIVVRRRDGSLHVRERGMTDTRKGLAKLPLVRGVHSLVESLKLGAESMRFAGDLMERDAEAEEAAAAKAPPAKKGAGGAGAGMGASALGLLQALGYATFLLLTMDGDAPPSPKEEKKARGPMILLLGLMISVMVALPQLAAWGASRVFGWGLDLQSPGFQVVTGGFKLAIVIGYMLMIRRLPPIRRVFQYHGAEHKTISTYEAGEALTVANARPKTTLHPRCGTTFLVMVALVSILVFMAVGRFLPKIDTGKEVLNQLVFLLEKLPFLPLIAAVTFEIQRVFAKYCTTGPLRALLWPGFLVQKITTIEPDDDQLEIALASLRVTLFRERGVEKSASSQPDDVRYASFDSLMSSGRLRRTAAS